jgi:hypothetical protein|tara:strand:+ start:1494 stop:1889 length:396 start_codon:yes stop_codon:yes gene_type:complete
MATEITATAAGSAAVTVLGAWELRAGSHDTSEWLDGAADVSYPGGGPGTFQASNSDGANGYDPAPKMALLEVTTASGTAAVTLAGGISSVLMVMSSQQDGTAAANKVAYSGLVVTVTGATAQKHNVLVMYN